MRYFPIMRIHVLISCLFLLTFPGSCKNGGAAPKATPTPAAETAMDPPAAPPPLVVPMIDRACSTDADCTVTSNPKIEDGVCCMGCPSIPAARSWAMQVVKRCNQYNTRNQVSGCPKVLCSDVPDVVCRGRECQFQR
ncbi:MAG: hypothetical protein CVU65_13515 [Deltaproteobacteria bacterium HGW-Deltaproteobacteria-22]|nr:MAG: hypothetical protein CVU65_13515 [Deltaproteobacteria bacterium HGW-Deltaproteobacteria-22]